MRSIVMVGLMGSGKSTVGTLVAAALGWPLVDSDRAIEARTGSSVRELWEEGGEAAYRRLESAVVLDALAPGEPASVVAAPGGVVLDPAVRAALAGAFVVWLRGEPAVLAARVQRGDHRPLLGDDPLRVLTTMAADRADLYAGVADAVLDVDGTTPEALARAVLDAAAPRPPRPAAPHERGDG